ncbi:MAG: T9SS type A sorting domain-containing protein [Bacteroidales bacterium]|nr:T9SS type A sorting domain-containing protein [Bacteroidales bacterium]HOK75173.1 T9SS type A sorting domain-containing protein [Bacteroidales bacterium]
MKDITKKSLSIYPQPASDYLYVTLNLEKSTNLRWEITDMMGTRIAQNRSQTHRFENNNLKIDVSELTPGMYILKIHTNNTTAVSRFIIAR